MPHFTTAVIEEAEQWIDQSTLEQRQTAFEALGDFDPAHLKELLYVDFVATAKAVDAMGMTVVFDPHCPECGSDATIDAGDASCTLCAWTGVEGDTQAEVERCLGT